MKKFVLISMFFCLNLLSVDFYNKDFFEKNADVMLIIDKETKNFLNANESALKFYGYTKKEFLDVNVNDINMFTLKQIKEEIVLL
jgi:PAS domain S-box-containing protein